VALRRIPFLALIALLTTTVAKGQETAQTPTPTQETPIPQLLPGSARPAGPDAASKQGLITPKSVPLTVPKGTSLQVALEKEVRIKRAGQCVHAQVVEPVYAFDHLVVPVGAKIRGEVTRIERLSGGKRMLAGLDGDFTPARKVEVRFTDMEMADGRHIPLHTSVTPGSGQVLKFVSAPDKETKKTIKDVAAEKTKEAKQQARDQWNNAMAQLKTPGRIHRLHRYAEAQLPLHYQYIPAGTIYFAELEDPLDFGTEPLTPQMVSSLGAELPGGSVAHARLLTPLSSATAQKGQEVEAVLTRPLLDGGRLIYPQGSKLVGAVGQVRPARRLKRNGQLRIAFHQVVLPDGVAQRVQAALVGVEAGKGGNVKLDSEGGAEATNSKSRYADFALSAGLAFFSSIDGDGVNRASGGASGFKLVGAVMGAFVHSRAFGQAMGAYGTGMSFYRKFVARGHEVEFPKNTAMEIGIGTRAAAEPAPEQAPKAAPSAGGSQ